jgi:hypothetical protein
MADHSPFTLKKTFPHGCEEGRGANLTAIQSGPLGTSPRLVASLSSPADRRRGWFTDCRLPPLPRSGTASPRYRVTA